MELIISIVGHLWTGVMSVVSVLLLLLLVRGDVSQLQVGRVEHLRVYQLPRQLGTAGHTRGHTQCTGDQRRRSVRQRRSPARAAVRGAAVLRGQEVTLVRLGKVQDLDAALTGALPNLLRLALVCGETGEGRSALGDAYIHYTYTHSTDANANTHTTQSHMAEVMTAKP